TPANNNNNNNNFINFDVNPSSFSNVSDYLMYSIHMLPTTSVGWLRAGIGFYNSGDHNFALDCFNESIKLDPMNYNVYQIASRSYIALNRREEAIEALKQSVKLGNPTDWQLLIELTAQNNDLK